MIHVNIWGIYDRSEGSCPSHYNNDFFTESEGHTSGTPSIKEKAFKGKWKNAGYFSDPRSGTGVYIADMSNDFYSVERAHHKTIITKYFPNKSLIINHGVQTVDEIAVISIIIDNDEKINNTIHLFDDLFNVYKRYIGRNRETGSPKQEIDNIINKYNCLKNNNSVKKTSEDVCFLEYEHHTDIESYLSGGDRMKDCKKVIFIQKEDISHLNKNIATSFQDKPEIKKIKTSEPITTSSEDNKNGPKNNKWVFIGGAILTLIIIGVIIIQPSLEINRQYKKVTTEQKDKYYLDDKKTKSTPVKELIPKEGINKDKKEKFTDKIKKLKRDGLCCFEEEAANQKIKTEKAKKQKEKQEKYDDYIEEKIKINNEINGKGKERNMYRCAFIVNNKEIYVFKKVVNQEDQEDIEEKLKCKITLLNKDNYEDYKDKIEKEETKVFWLYQGPKGEEELKDDLLSEMIKSLGDDKSETGGQKGGKKGGNKDGKNQKGGKKGGNKDGKKDKNNADVDGQEGNHTKILSSREIEQKIEDCMEEIEPTPNTEVIESKQCACFKKYKKHIDKQGKTLKEFMKEMDYNINCE